MYIVAKKRRKTVLLSIWGSNTQRPPGTGLTYTSDTGLSKNKLFGPGNIAKLVLEWFTAVTKGLQYTS